MAGGSTEDSDQASAARWLRVPGLGWLTRVELWLDGTVLAVRHRSPGSVEVMELPLECVKIDRRRRLRGSSLIAAFLLFGWSIGLLATSLMTWPVEPSPVRGLVAFALLLLAGACALGSILLGAWFLVPRAAVTLTLPEPWSVIGFWLVGGDSGKVGAMLHRIEQMQPQLESAGDHPGEAAPVATPLSDVTTSWWMLALILAVYVLAQVGVLLGWMSAWWLLLLPLPVGFILWGQLRRQWSESADLRGARRLLQERRPAAALELLDRHLGNAPGDVEARWLRVEVLAASGRRQEALAAMNQGLNLLDPDEAGQLIERIEIRSAIASRRRAGDGAGG